MLFGLFLKIAHKCFIRLKLKTEFLQEFIVKSVYIFLLSTLLLFSPALFAGTPDDFSIQIELLTPQKLDVLYLADIDLQNFDTSEDIFSITVRKNAPGEFRNCYFYFELMRDNESIITATSEPFTIPASFTEKTFTNRDLASGFDFGEGQIAYFHQVNLADITNQLRDDILKSGKLPVGIYKIFVELRQISDRQVVVGRGEKILFRATNPSYLQLVSPGVAAGNGLKANIYTQYPVFQWSGNGTEYQVFVFEKKEMMQSYDDIINGQPNWVSERIDKLSIQYPQAATAIPLEFGKTYYWIVRMYSQTSGGDETQDSEVWEFTVVNPEQATDLQNQIVREDILQFLAEILGPQINEVRASLEGYQLKTIRFNGEEITLNQLYDILNRLKGQSFKIVDFIPPSAER